MDGNSVICVGIAGIVVIESVALYLGVNGVLMSSALAGIASLVGYAFGQKSQKKQ